MKKKLLMMVPLIALATSCGSDPLASVSKTLPLDVTPVSTATEAGQEAYYGAIDKVVEGVPSFDFSKAVYNLSLALSLNVSGSVNGMSFGGSLSLNGSVTVGFDQYTVSEETYSRFFMSVDNFALSANIMLPAAVLERMPVSFPTNMNYRLSFIEYIEETPDGAFMYADYSDHGLQNIISSIISMNVAQQDQINSVLDSVLGQKDASGYRPGLVKMDLSEILSSASDMMVSIQQQSNPYGTPEGLPAEVIQKPVSYAINTIKGGLEEIMEDYGQMIPYIASVASPYVGVAYDDAGALKKASVVFNVSIANLVSQMGGDPSQLPVSGYVGLLASVGTDHGSTTPVLEQLELSAIVNASIEGVSVAFNGTIAFNAYFNNQANVRHVSNKSAYIDATDFVTRAMSSGQR